MRFLSNVTYQKPLIIKNKNLFTRFLLKYILYPNNLKNYFYKTRYKTAVHIKFFIKALLIPLKMIRFFNSNIIQ